MLREMPGYFDLVISDVHMPEMSGFQLLQCILQEFATLPVFLMSGDDDREMVRKGIENGAAFYLTKPLTYSDIEKLWQHVFTKNMQTKNMRKTESRGQNSLQHNKQKISSIDGSSSKANDQEHTSDSLRRKNQKISNIGGSSSKANDQNQKIGNICGSQYSFPSFQEESRDSSFNAQSLLLPGNNNQRLATPAHQTWLAHNTSIENEQSMNPQNIATISHSNTTISGSGFISDPNFNIGGTSSKVNDQNQKIGNIGGTQYSFSSFQEESRDSGFQGFNAQPLLLPANNNQRLATPAHQTWLAHNTSIENEQSVNPQNIATISHSNTTISGSGFISDPKFNIGGTSSKANDQIQKIGNIGGTQYSFSSFQEESRDSRFQGFNAQPLLLPANNNQRLATPAHQTWLAHNTSIENEQSVNPQNIATISHSNTTISGNEFISDPNFNISEHLVGGDTDDPQNTTISHCNTTISGNEFMSDPNFNISEYLVDGDTDDQQNIATTSHCNTTISCNEFMSVLNFNISEYLVDGDTDDSDII
ncbi:hypothetical protein MKW92_051328 [Papaver armeniacum]|nr:hypothetical protein MKW92_051328 [Papaver armeniacum]